MKKVDKLQQIIDFLAAIGKIVIVDVLFSWLCFLVTQTKPINPKPDCGSCGIYKGETK